MNIIKSILLGFAITIMLSAFLFWLCYVLFKPLEMGITLIVLFSLLIGFCIHKNKKP